MKLSIFNFSNFKFASAGAISTFIILTFMIISGIGFIVSYQNFTVQSQQDYEEFQNKMIEASQIDFIIQNISYNGFGELSFIVTNTGLVDIDTKEFSYFADNSFLQNIQTVSIENQSQTKEILTPQSSMLVISSTQIIENQSLTIKVTHDSTLRQLNTTIIPLFIGETGSFSVQNNENVIISFQREYDETPAIFMTPKTDNVGGNLPYVAIVHSINTTHANVSLCQDSGTSTCDLTYITEEVSFMVIDINTTNSLDFIEVGFVNAATSGVTTPISFSKTFDNTPYIFAQAQTYNIDSIVSNGIGAHSWATSITVSSAGLIGCDHPGIANYCNGTSTERFAYLAINPITQSIDTLNIGTEDISNSDWTTVSFTNTYTNPQIQVLQNDDAGSQDPQYPWARNVGPSGADIRYCEADTGGVCDGHTTETVRWISIEEGAIRIDN